MNEDLNECFVPYEQALALKNLGFDKPCFGYYHDKILTGVNKWDRKDFEFHAISKKNITSITVEIILAPLYQQAFDFFLKEYGLWFRPDHYSFIGNKDEKENEFTGVIHELGKYSAVAEIGNYQTDKKAQLECLKKLIEIVEKINNNKH